MNVVRMLLVGAFTLVAIAFVLIFTIGGVGGVLSVLFLAMALAIAALIVHERRKLASWERSQQGKCSKCGYRISGESRCPECGERCRFDA